MEIRDFAQELLDDDITISEMYEKTGINLLLGNKAHNIRRR